MGTNIPNGFCQCGCGKRTALATITDKRAGYIKGQYKRFVSGHNGLRNISERFWEKVDKRGPDECWPWKASLDHAGYGQFVIDHRPHHAHRVAYMLTHGEMPVGFQVLHSCDNPPCCNPNHLSKGTNQDNVDDMIRKGRQASKEIRSKAEKLVAHHGSDHHNSKLTETQVLEIRRLHETGEWSQAQLAKKFKISQPNIHAIVYRKYWTHI